jgi:hypothetical protein
LRDRRATRILSGVMRLMPILFLAAGCAASRPLADGVYEVRAVMPTADALPRAGADERVLLFDRQFLREGEAMRPAHVLVRTTGFAPLTLAAPPVEGEANGRAVLQVTLTPEAARALTRLTSRADRAAVIVDGAIVTVHRVRVPIEGGQLQVSC